MTRFLEKLYNAPHAYSFRDLILLPGYQDKGVDEIKLNTHIGRIELETPFLSSCMDTVTEANMAIAMAECGGLGIIHRNCSTTDQLKMVEKVADSGAFVGAAFSPYDVSRAVKLSKYANVLMMDIAHADKSIVYKYTRAILKDMEPDTELVFGSVGTTQGASNAIEELDGIVVDGLAGLRCGIGSGSICTTSEVTRCGSPTAYAVAQAADSAFIPQDRPFSIVADGGMTTPGDVALALALGADAVMSGRLFAGTEETPGLITTDAVGKSMKAYRGMGSFDAIQRRKAEDRYSPSIRRVPEGISSYVPLRGPVRFEMEELIDGLKAAFSYAGADSIQRLQLASRIATVTPEDKITTRGLIRG